MKRKIEISSDVRKFLEAAFGVTGVMVWKALTYESSSDLARRIRKLAIDKGGEVVVTLPECETIHTWDGKMEQTFSNGAVLLIDKPTGEFSVTHKGKIVKKGTVVTFPDLDKLQEEIASLG